MERRLRDEYLATVEDILARLDASNIEAGIALACYPDEIRGYGPVKEEAILRVEPKANVLRSRFDKGSRRQLTTAA